MVKITNKTLYTDKTLKDLKNFIVRIKDKMYSESEYPVKWYNLSFGDSSTKAKRCEIQFTEDESAYYAWLYIESNGSSVNYYFDIRGNSISRTEGGNYHTAVLFAQNRLNNLAEVLNKEGVKLYADGNFAAAEKFEAASRRCIEGYALKYKYWSNKGNSLVAQEKYREAIEAFGYSIKIAPEDKKQYITDLKTEAENKIKNQEAESLNAEGVEFYKSGNFIAAEAKFDAACIICADDYELRYIFLGNKGKSLAAQKRYSGAIQAFRASIKIAPQEKNKRFISFKQRLRIASKINNPKH